VLKQLTNQPAELKDIIKANPSIVAQLLPLEEQVMNVWPYTEARAVARKKQCAEQGEEDEQNLGQKLATQAQKEADSGTSSLSTKEAAKDVIHKITEKVMNKVSIGGGEER
jgi:hypothetical protein